MSQLKVTLLHNTPLWVCATAVRTCWDSHNKSDNGGPKDQQLIDKVGNKFKHASTLEHLNYTFFIEGFSRAVLQELSRHRIASPSVKSSRYTLKELKDAPTITHQPEDFHLAESFCVMTGDTLVDSCIIAALVNLQELIRQGIKNDIAKYAMPDAYRTTETLTINARSLQNFLGLRTASGALWGIQDVANAIYEQIPDDHKYLFAHCLPEEKPNET